MFQFTVTLTMDESFLLHRLLTTAAEVHEERAQLLGNSEHTQWNVEQGELARTLVAKIAMRRRKKIVANAIKAESNPSRSLAD